MARLVLRMLVVVLLATTASFARADSRLQFLSEQLRYPPAAGQQDDFRVRTNAALALGATNDEGAVSPLCSGLDDPSAVVRQAVAVALKKLARASSLDCMQRHLATESNDGVKSQLQRAIDAVNAGGGGGGGGTTVVANAKYYISISPITNNTSRSASDVERIVHGAIATKLGQLGEYQLAPAGESNADAKAAIARRSLKGFYLSVSVDKFDYSDGNLRVKVKIAVFSYPGKDLRGEVPAGATVQGTRPGDTASEDQLMGVVSARAAELFAQNFK